MVRKSKQIKLAAAVSSLAFLAACSAPESPADQKVDQSNADALNTCLANPNNTADKCEEYFGQTATKKTSYSAKAQCEAEYGTGQCESRQASDGSSVFMPLAIGYLLGNMNSSGRTVVHHYTPPPSDYYDRPHNYGYKSSNSGNYNNGSNGRTTFARSSGSSYTSTRATSSVRSGGFGGSAAHMGGCCS